MQGVAEPAESRTRPTTATISRIPRKVLIEFFSYPDDNLDHNQTLLMINQLNFYFSPWSDAPWVPDEDKDIINDNNSSNYENNNQ